ncbi:MAG: ATP synthase F1 subunit epsilon [Acidimicrobiales bacterium]|jgi:F-type H+-transporting ATPase subunit epsilon
MATLRVEIVSPEVALWAGDATAFIARSSEGFFTILPEHTDTVGDLVPGVVRVETNEGEIAFAVHGGFFQCEYGPSDGETKVTVLAGVSELVTSIDVPRAQAAKEAAEAELSVATRDDQADETAHQMARDALARAELRLAAAK